MKLIRRMMAWLLVACLLCGSYGSSASAAENISDVDKSSGGAKQESASEVLENTGNVVSEDNEDGKAMPTNETGTADVTDTSDGTEIADGADISNGDGTENDTNSSDDASADEKVDDAADAQDESEDVTDESASVQESEESAGEVSGSVDMDELLAMNVGDRLAAMSAEDDIAGGSYGDIAWVIDADGKLTVVGTGDFSDSDDYERAPWYYYRTSIVSAKVNVTGMTNASYMFVMPSNSYNRLTNLDLSSFDTSQITDMSNMFSFCDRLTSLDLSNFNTSQVEYMDDMFYKCNSLTSLDLSSFDTSRVRNMSYMFYECSGLASIDLSSFNTSRVWDMVNMFSGCSKLTSLDLSGFDTSQVTNMYHMFYDCSRLTSLDLSSFNTDQVTNMNNMFNNCSSLTSLNLSGFDTSKVEIMRSMFSECSSLTSLDLGSFDTSQIENMDNMFNNCSSLTSLDLSSFNTAQVTSMDNMFNNCSSLTSLDLSSFNTAQVTSMGNIFNNCNSLTTIHTPYNLSAFVGLPSKLGEVWTRPDGTEITMLPLFLSESIVITKNEKNTSGSYGNITWAIDIEGKLTVEGSGDFSDSEAYSRAPWYKYRNSVISAEVNVISMTDASYMFYECENLISLDLSGFDTGQVTNMESMFSYCSSLRKLDLSKFDTSQVDNMKSMFYECENLISLNLSGFDTGQVTNMASMFSYCRSLKRLDLSKFDTSQVDNMEYMFTECESLTDLDLSSFDTSQVTNMDSMFDWCLSLTDLDLSSFNTSQVRDMTNMFFGCKSLTSLDLSGFKTSKVTTMEQMFCNCSSLANLNLSNFDTSQVTDMVAMFFACGSLTSLDLSSFDTGKVTSIDDMFNNSYGLTTIHAPYNLTLSVTLPIQSGEVWTTSYGTEITELPQNLSESIVITKTKNGIVSDDDIASGTYENITWVIDADGKLTVEGTGDFSDSYGESRAPWYENRVSIKSAKINVTGMTGASFMFYGCENLTRIDLSNFNTNEVIDMSYMFCGCTSLENLDLSGFDTSQVTDMSYMFSNCRSLTKLDFSALDTSKVTNIDSMFSNCISLIDLDLSSFNAEQVITNYGIIDMFINCPNLSKIKTPYRLKVTVTLPTQSGEVWTMPDGTEITELPQNLSESITIVKKTSEASLIISYKNVTYECGDTLNIDDFGIELRYCDTDGTISIVTDYTTNAGEIDMSAPGTKTLIISYKGLTKEIEFTVTEKSEGLKIQLQNRYFYYTGSAIKPEVTVTDKGRLLVEGTDYTVKYSNNVNVSVGTRQGIVTVTGKGNLSGSVSDNFIIIGVNIANSNVTAGRMVVVAGKKISAPILYYGSVKLTAKDFTYDKTKTFSLTDENPELTINAVSGGNFYGTRYIDVKVVANSAELKAAMQKFTVEIDKDKAKNLVYGGKDVSLDEKILDCITVKDKTSKSKIEETNENGTPNYKIALSQSTNAGTVKIMAVGMGDYSGCNITKSCKILPRTITRYTNIVDDITDTSILLTTDETSSHTFKGTGADFGNMTLKWNDEVMTEGKDYKVTYSGNKKAGPNAKCTITFRGNYKGKLSFNFSVEKAKLSADSIDKGNGLVIPDMVCKGQDGVYKSKPYISIGATVVKASEYEVKYYIDEARTIEMSKTKPLPINGKASATVYVEIKAKEKNYTTPTDAAPITGSYTVFAKKPTSIDLSKAKVTFYSDAAGTNRTAKFNYTGNPVTPGKVVIEINGSLLTYGTDYTYEVINNVNKGKASVIIKSADGSNYIGTKTSTFSIVARSIKNYTIQ